ncbi:hypothetical protein OROGR_020656 [Orobanche gracilis]
MIVVKTEQKPAKRAINKAKSGTTKRVRDPQHSTVPWTWQEEAFSIFIREYKVKHFKPPPSGTWAILPEQLISEIMQAWRGMSEREKAPYLKGAKKIEAERVNAEKKFDEMRAKGLL